MTKIINLILLLSLTLSCNSSDKKEDYYSQKSSQNQSSIDRGKIVYEDMCITCHLADGKGVEKVFPPLANSDYLNTNQEESIKAVKYGMSGEIEVNGITYNNMMSPLGLSDAEVADVMNYINNSWGNTIDNVVTPEMVSNL